MNLTTIATGVQRHITAEHLHRITPDPDPDPDRPANWPTTTPYLINPTVTVAAEHLADRLTATLKGHLIAERLPPQEITHTWHGHHDITWSKTITVPRHATWWQSFKDTYRTRWWLRAAVRRWPVRWVNQPVTVTDTQRRDCAHHITVPVAAAWTYPQAPRALTDGLHAGPAVLTTWTGDAATEFTIDPR